MMIHECMVCDHFPKGRTLTFDPSSGKKQFSSLPQRGHIRTVVCPLLLPPQCVPSIAPHLLLTFTLCLLLMSSWRFLPSRYTFWERTHTKQRVDKNYELLECLSFVNLRRLSKLTCNFLQLLVFIMLTDLMDEMNVNTRHLWQNNWTYKNPVQVVKCNQVHLLKCCIYLQFWSMFT